MRPHSSPGAELPAACHAMAPAPACQARTVLVSCSLCTSLSERHSLASSAEGSAAASAFLVYEGRAGGGRGREAPPSLMTSSGSLHGSRPNCNWQDLKRCLVCSRSSSPAWQLQQSRLLRHPRSGALGGHGAEQTFSSVFSSSNARQVLDDRDLSSDGRWGGVNVGNGP